MTHDTEALTERLARAIAVHARVPEDIGWRIYAGHIRAALASIPGSGWRLVPEVATEEMLANVIPCPEHLIAERNDPIYEQHMRAATATERLMLSQRYLELLNAAPAIGEVGNYRIICGSSKAVAAHDRDVRHDRTTAIGEVG